MTVTRGYSEEDIETLTGLDIYRANPKPFIKDKGIIGQNHTIFEAFDNALDEHKILLSNEYIDIAVSFNKSGYSVLVNDFGRGIPTNKFIDVTSKPNTSGKYKNSGAYSASRGSFGIGLKVLNALSLYSVVMSVYNGVLSVVVFHDGKIVKHRKIENTNLRSGTAITFTLDKQFFEDMELYPTEGLNNLISYMEFISVFSPTTRIRTGIVNDLKVKALAKYLMDCSDDEVIQMMGVLRNPEYKQIRFIKDDKLTVESFINKEFENKDPFVWSITDLEKPLDPNNYFDKFGYSIRVFLPSSLKVQKKGIIGAVNLGRIDDPESDHIACVIEALKTMLGQYITDEDIAAFFKSKYKLPVYMVVNVFVKDVEYDDLTKKLFKDKTHRKNCYSYLIQEFKTKYSEETWLTLYSFLQEDIIAKFREAVNKNYSTPTKSLGLALKKDMFTFINCTSKVVEERELFIVEGESAKGSAARAANNYNQAILAIRGKIINGIQRQDKRFFEDRVIKNLMTIVGISPTHTDLSNINFGKIFILADADDHGGHIASLIAIDLLRINPLLISSGRVYASNPPLYSLKLRDKNVVYLKDFDALMELRIQQVYMKFLQLYIRIRTSNTYVEISGADYVNLVYTVEALSDHIETAASVIGINPVIIEGLLRNISKDENIYHLNEDGIKADLKATHLERRGELLYISIGPMDILVPWKRLVTELNKYLYYEFMKFHGDIIDIAVTTLKTSEFDKTPMFIYTLSQTFKTLNGILGKYARFKGLGEMNPKDLRETCFNPFTRSAFQIKDIGDIEQLKAIFGKDTTARKNLILGGNDDVY